VPASGELGWAVLSDFLNALAAGAQATTFQKFAVRKCLTTPVTVSATTDCVIVTQLTSPGVVAVNLPAGADKQVYIIADGTADAATNTVTINRAGSDTIAGATSITLTHNRESVILVYNASDTDWKIVARAGAPGTVVSGDISGAILPAKGGTGIVNNTASTLTISGAFGTTLTVTGTTSVTLPTSGTLARTSGETFITPTLGVASSTSMTYTQTASSGTGVTVNATTQAAYEEVTLVTTLSNFNASPPAITIKMTRVGKVVSLCVIAQVSEASKSNTNDPVTVNNLPTPFRPTQPAYLPWMVRNNNVYQIGVALVATSGLITFQLETLGAWTGSAQADILPASGSYILL
jgi:hypothetical protein